MKKSRGRLTLARLFLIVMIPLVCSQVSAGGILVITDQSTPVDSIDDALIKKIFLGKKRTLPDGEDIEFVVLKSGDAHDTFLKNYVGKTRSQYNTYWKKQVFSGKGRYPKSFASEGELLNYLSGKSGIIGYVSTSVDLGSAKVVNEK